MPAVNIKHATFDVRIDRKTKWGNPFMIGRDGDRDAVREKYRRWLWAEIKAWRVDLTELAQLRGKRLGCHCAPQRCHGDTLSAAAEWAHAQITAQADSASVAAETDGAPAPRQAVVTTTQERDPKTGMMRLVADRAVEIGTMKTRVVPAEHP